MVLLFSEVTDRCPEQYMQHHSFSAMYVRPWTEHQFELYNLFLGVCVQVPKHDFVGYNMLEIRLSKSLMITFSRRFVLRGYLPSLHSYYSLTPSSLFLYFCSRSFISATIICLIILNISSYLKVCE